MFLKIYLLQTYYNFITKIMLLKKMLLNNNYIKKKSVTKTYKKNFFS